MERSYDYLFVAMHIETLAFRHPYEHNSKARTIKYFVGYEIYHVAILRHECYDSTIRK